MLWWWTKYVVEAKALQDYEKRFLNAEPREYVPPPPVPKYQPKNGGIGMPKKSGCCHCK